MRKLHGPERIARWSLYRPQQRFPIAAVLDNIRSAQNVGSIFRTAECAYIRHLYLCGITPRPPNRKIEKTALGTTLWVPWSYYPDPLDAVQYLKDQGWTIAALELTDESVPIDALSLKLFPLALIVGNEVTGVDDRLLAVADLAVEIRQYGEKESLNVAVAFGVAVFSLIAVLQGGQRERQTPDAVVAK
ncbi:MAG: RNA methyltransferase [Armatimonadetes bacterium]|nr:RNA methyltransferase [Armatimonadota bacterium]MDW8121997.1 RNA methyltransferase [Armatimonadota bacterium]